MNKYMCFMEVSFFRIVTLLNSQVPTEALPASNLPIVVATLFFLER